MLKIYFVLAFSLLINFVAYTQGFTYEPIYSTGFDTPEDQSAWMQFNLGDEPPNYQWEYLTNNAFSEPSSLGHWYPVGGMEPTDNWMVSPVMDLSDGGIVDSVWASYAGFGTPYNIDTVALYVLSGNQNPDLADSKELIHLFSDSTYMNDQVWRRYDSIPIPPSTNQAYLAFRYQTIINWLDVKFDDMYVQKKNLVAIENTLTNSIRLNSNPIKNELQLVTDSPSKMIQANLQNANGQTVLTFTFDNNTSIDVAHLSTGIYFLSLQTDTEQGTFKVVKQ